MPVAKYQDVQAVTITIPHDTIQSGDVTITHNLAKMKADGTGIEYVWPSIISVEISSADPLIEIPWFTALRPIVPDGKSSIEAHIEMAWEDDIVINAVVTCVYLHTVNQ